MTTNKRLISKLVCGAGGVLLVSLPFAAVELFGPEQVLRGVPVFGMVVLAQMSLIGFLSVAKEGVVWEPLSTAHEKVQRAFWGLASVALYVFATALFLTAFQMISKRVILSSEACLAWIMLAQMTLFSLVIVFIPVLGWRRGLPPMLFRLYDFPIKGLAVLLRFLRKGKR